MFSINYRDQRPIYIQVKDSLRLAIITGAIEADGRLPTVRELAAQLTINPNTIQRAYRELEQEGYIYTVPGRGCFASRQQEVDEGRKTALFRQFDGAVTELMYLGISVNELCARVKDRGRGND